MYMLNPCRDQLLLAGKIKWQRIQDTGFYLWQPLDAKLANYYSPFGLCWEIVEY